MWIVKLGGSLARDATLGSWLRALAEFGGGRVAVVPGGGAFAEQVRAAQTQWGFDDLAAHNMAVLGMAQMAQMLHALEPRLVLAAAEDEIRQVIHTGRVALWVPYAALRDAPDMLTTWDVTSDSLALWLARRLNAERVLVVKACAVDPSLGLAELAAAGVLDRRFPDWAMHAAFPVDVLQADAVESVRLALVRGEWPPPTLPRGDQPRTWHAERSSAAPPRLPPL
jgi:aspartokinase-like uncharacterized kinase